MDVLQVPKKKHKKRLAFESDDEDEEDDGEEVKDLIDDAPIEDEDSENESESSKRRNRSDEDDSDDRLSDEDYDLLEENLGVKVQRKKFKRLKRIQDEESDEEHATDREAIANQLFEGSDNEGERPQETAAQYRSEESEGEYSETDDFIVDDDGRPLTEKREKRKPIFTDASLKEAQDIFRVDFDYDEFEKYDGEDYEDADAEEEEEYEDEEQRNLRKASKASRQKRKQKSIYEIYEPSELARAGFTDEDNRIRITDIPERMQLRTVPVLPAEDDELDEEAEWIYEIAFNKKKKNDANLPLLTQEPTAQENVPAASEPTHADENDWEVTGPSNMPVTWDQPSAIVTTPVQQQANANDDDDWEVTGPSTTPVTWDQPSAVVTTPVQQQANADDDEDWDAAPAPVQPKRDVAPVNQAPDDGDDWDNMGDQITTAPARSETTLVEDRVEDEVKAKTISKIRKALEFMRNQYREVPFIAFYRKEYVSPELNMNDLWSIYRLDAKFCQLHTRKVRLSTLYKNMQDYQTDIIMANSDAPISDSMRIITPDDLERIKKIKTQEEFKDMYSQFILYYSSDLVAMKQALKKKRKEKQAKRKETSSNSQAETDIPEEPEVVESEEEMNTTIKRNIGGGTYGLCRKLKLDGLVKKFGLTPTEFAKNLRDNYQRHEIEQYPIDPIQAALDYVSPRLSDPEKVLKAAKFMVATQISREPLVRQTVREVFCEHALMSITPTKKGFKEINENHPIYRMKYLKNKPIQDLVGDQFLKLAMAEDDNLIKISFGEKIKGITTSNYVDEVKQLYNKDEFSKTVQDWNQLRGECVEFALEKLLFPVFRNELRAKLLEDARQHVLQACAKKLHHWLEVAPYKASFLDEDDKAWDTRKGIKVLSITYFPDFHQPAFACFVNSDGEPLYHLSLQNITKYRTSFKESDRLKKEADLVAIKNFIRQNKPHVIVIGGESRKATMIQEDLRCVVSELCSEDGFPSINVEILDNQPAKVYANSIKANNDFSECPALLREAVSLGRRIQDPLMEFSQLTTADDEILCLRLHPLQDQVPKDVLLEYLHIEFVNRTNEVGIDINRAIMCPYRANLLQFVCGLGPRKALALMKILMLKSRRLENRNQLITVCHMGPNVFINCSGFIKIDTNSLGDSTEAYVEVLDGSRVHPETYEWATKMAVVALEYDDEDANPAGALEEVLEAPERLKDLDLDAFTVELQRQGFGDKSITLCDIRSELINRYVDLRTQYQVPNKEELFNMLTKESPESLYIGKLVTANVVGISHKKPQGEQLDNAIPVRNEETGMWQCAFCMKNDFPDLSEVWNHFDAGACPGQATGVRIRLDNGIGGFIPIAKLSDKQVINPESRVKRGQTIHCRITKIDPERFSVDCTSRSSDLLDAKNELKPQKDPYYDHESESRDIKKEEDQKKIRLKQTYIKRVIVHPSFKNISFRESEKIMDQMDQGEVIVRPSSKGTDHLTVTWKVADGVYQHVDVREVGKANAFSLGQSLWIGNDEFEDLDEIITRYINPMASQARDILNFKYYQHISGDSTQFAEKHLFQEKQKCASKIHYMIYATKEYPGKFLISCLHGNNVRHEFITITPEGIRFRQMVFDSLNHTLKWFKSHPIKGPAPKQYPQPQRFLHQLPPCSQPQFGLPLHPLTSTATTNHVSTPVPTSLCNQSQPERPPELSWSDPGQMNVRKYEEKVVSDLPFVPVTMNPQELEVMSQAIQQQAEEGSSYTVKYLQSKGLIDPLLPQQLKEMFGALYCKLCTLTLSSPVVAQAHYVGKKHKKKIDQWLNEHRLETLQSSFVRSGSGIPGTVKPVKSGATTNNNILSQPSSMQSAVKQRPKHLKRSGLGNSGVPNKKIRKAGEAGPNFDFCAICQIELTSAAHANQHYNGQKHTAKILKHTRNFGACNLEDRTFGIGKAFHKQN